MNHIVALSGGKDSTAMALRLSEVNPNIEYDYVITPTGDELPEMFAHWRKLGELLGKPLQAISRKSLKGVCRDNNMLPNWRARFCTRQLKIEPFIAFLLDHTPAVAYVGLRADEEAREGAIYGEVDDIRQAFPLRDWGWSRSDVVGYLQHRGVKVPNRTDCARCFFQRLGEWWNLWKDQPDIYEDAVQQETEFGHTFRSPGRDTWPASLKELRGRFEAGDVPRGADNQLTLFDTEREHSCRVCAL